MGPIRLHANLGKDDPGPRQRLQSAADREHRHHSSLLVRLRLGKALVPFPARR